MAGLPSGTVTFLFTDLEGSTRLWEDQPELMHDVMARHDEIVRYAIEAHGGHVVKTTGDGFHAAFSAAHDALAAAIAGQVGLRREGWGATGPLVVRMGIHSGPAELRDGDYYGTAVNRAARLMSVAHGGQIVVSLATEELVQESGVELVDLGVHSLRDLARPERVFQVVHSELPREFARLRSLDAFPGNLPVQVTSFVGRNAELTAIGEALAAVRLVTLTGVGGVGKTRLAVHVAADVLPRFADGAWFCELAAAEDAETMVQVVATSLGVVPRAEMSLAASIVEFLRTKQLLVVLDNCEHLLDPAGRLADAMLRQCPNVSVLATSREILSVEGEHAVGVRSLPLPDDSDSLGELAANDAVRLFEERAAASRSGFVLDQVNAASVAEVCRRLDGIPLAIELAAARVGSISPREIAGLLDERFRLLRGGRRTAMERHQTLRATVEWSYSLLSDHERGVFARLGVFAGSFDMAAVRAVVTDENVDEWDAVDALTGLVAKSMMVAEETPDGTTRYQMLETLRAYARERLDDLGESDGWRRRHGEYFAQLAEEIGPGLLGADELAWRARFVSELDNLRAAVVWALDSTASADHELAMRIVASLAAQTNFWRAGGVGALAERALPYVAATTPGRRAMILAAAAFSQYFRGDLDGARVLALDAVSEGTPPDSSFPALPFIALCSIYAAAGAHARGVAVIDDALATYPVFEHDDSARVFAAGSACIFEAFGGAFLEARARYEEVLPLTRSLRNPTLLAGALAGAGLLFADTEPDRAIAALDESIALTRAGAGNIAFELALTQRAQLHARAGNRSEALDALRDAVQHARDVGHRTMLTLLMTSTVQILTMIGSDETDEAAVVISSALATGDLRYLVIGIIDQQHDQLSKVVARLGDHRYEAARVRGAGLTFDDLIHYAVAEMDNALARDAQHDA